MIEVTLIGKHNSTFIVKDPKKIEYWKMLESRGEGMFVKVLIRNIKDKEKKA